MALQDIVQQQGSSGNVQKVAVSTTIQVTIGGTFIGVVQSLEPSQTRESTAVRGIGIGDQQLERVWGLSNYTLNVTKMALFQNFLFEALGYQATYRMLAELTAPIDITEMINLPNGGTVRNTIYQGCYLNNYTSPRTIDGNLIVMETASFDVTAILNGATSPFTNIQTGF